MAAERGAAIVPVWNKSNREHLIVGSEPASVRAAADAAVRELGWTRPYHVDADHINLTTVDRFLEASDFYTLDVASAIGKPATAADIDAFLSRHPELIGSIAIPGIEAPFVTTRESITEIAGNYLFAVQEAGRIYRHIASRRDPASFVTEVSMDETDAPQTPPQLLVILAAIADEKIPRPDHRAQIHRPLQQGRGLRRRRRRSSRRSSREDLAVIAHAVIRYGLPATLKLSVHSGSDKFSIYGAIRRALARSGAGVHIKTAGTTWLEELIGLAEGGGAGLALAKEVYAEAYAHREELCEPYAAVIDIDYAKLPRARRRPGVDGRRVHVGAAARPEQSRLQPERPPVAACRI